jgi:hypothetical protein
VALAPCITAFCLCKKKRSVVPFQLHRVRVRRRRAGGTNTTVLFQCTLLYAAAKARHRWMYGFRKCGSSVTRAQGKASAPGVRSQGSSVERRGCWSSPGRRKRKLWAIHPFAKGTGRPTGMAPPRRDHV